MRGGYLPSSSSSCAYSSMQARTKQIGAVDSVSRSVTQQRAARATKCRSSAKDDDVRMTLLSKKSERLRIQKCKIRPPPEFSCMHVGLSDTTTTTMMGLFTILYLTARSHVSPSLRANDRGPVGTAPNLVRQEYGKLRFRRPFSARIRQLHSFVYIYVRQT